MTLRLYQDMLPASLKVYSIKQIAWMYMPTNHLPMGQGMCGQHCGNASGFSRQISHRTSRAVEVQNIYQSKLMVYKYCQVQRNSENSACEASHAFA